MVVQPGKRCNGTGDGAIAGRKGWAPPPTWLAFDNCTRAMVPREDSLFASTTILPMLLLNEGGNKLGEDAMVRQSGNGCDAVGEDAIADRIGNSPPLKALVLYNGTCAMVPEDGATSASATTMCLQLSDCPVHLRLGGGPSAAASSATPWLRLRPEGTGTKKRRIDPRPPACASPPTLWRHGWVKSALPAWAHTVHCHAESLDDCVALGTIW